MITPRVKRLRDESVNTRPYLSTERAELITDFYQSDVVRRVSAPMCRALAFRYFIERRTIYVGQDELIVGERGPSPRSTPSYPELCCHTIEDLEVMNTRERTPFIVSSEAREVYEQRIIPFWNGSTIRDRLFAMMTDEWHAAFDAGVVTVGTGATFTPGMSSTDSFSSTRPEHGFGQRSRPSSPSSAM